MSNNVDSKGVTVSVKIYERLLATCPTAFRREYGPAMKQLFRDQCRDAWSQAKGRGLAVLWLRTLMDLAKTALVQYLTNLHRRESMCRKALRALRAFGTDAGLRASFIRLFALVFVFMFVFSICQMFWTPKIYSGITRIEVQNDLPQIPPSERRSDLNASRADPYFLTTQFKIIESYSILTNVIGTLHLDEKLARQSGDTHWTMDQTYGALFYNISVKPTRMSGLLEISVKNPDPKLAADIANAIVDTYRNSRLDKWKVVRFSGINALQTKLSEEEMKQGMMETNLKEMRAALKISDQDDERMAASTNIETEQFRKIQPYLSLKQKIEELRRNNEELNRTIQREVAEVGSPPKNAVSIRDPARPVFHPIQSMSDIFSIWMFRGTVLALVAGGLGAWLTYLIQHFSHRQSSLS